MLSYKVETFLSVSRISLRQTQIKVGENNSNTHYVQFKLIYADLAH